MKFGIILPHI